MKHRRYYRVAVSGMLLSKQETDLQYGNPSRQQAILCARLLVPFAWAALLNESHGDVDQRQPESQPAGPRINKRTAVLIGFMQSICRTAAGPRILVCSV